MAALAVVALAAGFVFTPPRNVTPERRQCVRMAAEFYHRPSDVLSVDGLEMLVHVVLDKEHGKIGQKVYNKPNKKGVRTYDIGPMQINSGNLYELGKRGVTEEQILNNECANIFVGTMILQEGIASAPDLWTGIGKYNAWTDRENGRKYYMDVWNRLNHSWGRN
ncbi:lytic transglycosylase domain-containing protein (plasmid) [Dyella sp. BiH032]|uniref:lytic transglycosylase domain-containing protein n=1 Tax=Dyella sp. BiH032 TaxID=3075430 RepID=UPI002892B1C3|nr:lytic transglycosylase domain-containing protein [Dyella sp. BiH032]WNL48547.1 lytic transglycosylase domain-containing protein [Dyella sp. BiH032]